MAPTRPTTQIYLVIEAGPTASVRLAAVLAGTHGVTALLIRPGAAPLDATAARPLVEQAQKSNVAALIEGDPALARALRADGVHLPWSPTLRAAYDDARDILGTRFMVGVGIATDAEQARHDAMELAEAGADYIGFEPSASATPTAEAATAQTEFAAWWAEIFQVPCVIFGIDTAVDANDFAALGVDFLGINLPSGETPADSAARIAEIAADVSPAPRVGARQ